VGLTIETARAADPVDAGMILRDRFNKSTSVVHPQISAISGVAYVIVRDVDPDGASRTCTAMWPGRVDRSPCGTGNSANLATLYARGNAKVGDIFKSRSIIRSEFDVGLSAITEAAGKLAIIPTITGIGFTFDLSQVSLDPLAAGFALADVWGPSAGEIKAGR
jgi:proline racemase